MKKFSVILAALVMLFMSSDAFAQAKFAKYGPDSLECMKYLSYYQEYYKQKAYDDAIPNWRQAYAKCPHNCSEKLLVDGSTLLRRLISKNASNPAVKDALVDSLLTLHEERAANYPKSQKTALINKGLDMVNYIKKDNMKLYKGTDEVIKAVEGATKPTVLQANLSSAIELYKEGQLDAEEVINVYQRNLEYLNATKPASETESKQIAGIKANIENLFISSKVASCENLIQLFTPRFEADPKNLDLATNIVKMMSIAGDCEDNELFLKAVTTMYNQDPSAKSAYYLYKLHASKNNVNEAISYLEEAISRDDSDLATDANYTYELAVYCFKNGKGAKAYELAGNVPSMDQALAGKAYLLMGTIWASSSCGGDEIERRAKYWAACDYMQKAKAADESLTEDANRNIGAYSVYFPKTEDAFMYDITNGQSYTVRCGGMVATTTVRTVK